MRFRPGFSVRLAAVAVVAAWGALLPGQARAYEFVDLATYTTSTTQTVGHACVLYNGTDMSCASTNPYVTSAGLVGIGTSNPTTALEVSGTVSATHFVGDGAGLTGIAPNVSSGLSGSIVYRDEFGGLHASSGFSISSTTGSVGIGAGAPGWVTNGLYTTGHLASAQNVFAGSGYGFAWGNDDYIVGDPTNHSIGITANNIVAVHIVSSGNVGIGTSAPSTRLQVGASPYTTLATLPVLLAGDPGAPATTGAVQSNGSLRLATNTLNSQVLDMGIYNISPYGAWLQAANGGNLSSNSPLIINPNGGNVGIGTTSPQASLNIAGTQIQIFDPTQAQANYSYIKTSAYTNNTQKLTFGTTYGYSTPVDALTIFDGNVGIGVADPSTSLHISGTLRLADGGEPCNADRAGAIKYSGGVFSFCAGSGWQSLAAAAGGGASQADRIVSTSANVVVGNGGTISFTTGGVSGTAYIDTAGRFVAAGVSTTGGISGTTGYFSGNVGIGGYYSLPWGAAWSTLGVNRDAVFGGSNGGPVYAFMASNLYATGDSPAGLPAWKGRLTGSNAAIYEQLGGSHVFSTAASVTEGADTALSTRMVINNAGNVGIGTTGPQTPLDVSGAIKISGNGTEGCTTTADEGKIRRNPVTKRFQICAH